VDTPTGSAAGGPAVVAENNGVANLYIEQTPVTTDGGAPPTNSIYSLVAGGSKATYGIRVFGGSSLTLRDSETPANTLDGILISPYNVKGVKSNDLSHIDLGTVASPRGNMFQWGTGQSVTILGTTIAAAYDGSAGICLDIPGGAGEKLNAAGNTFETANCESATTALNTSAACASRVDVGITGKGNSVNVLGCTATPYATRSPSTLKRLPLSRRAHGNVSAPQRVQMRAPIGDDDAQV
jgi:hypothetical protein